MLNHHPPTFLPFSVTLSLFLSLLLLKTQCQALSMDVQITNTEAFYYGHRCEVTFSFVSSNFSQFHPDGSETFMVTIVEANSGTRFLDYYVPPYLWAIGDSLVLEYTVDNCNRQQISSTFYCVQAIASPYLHPNVRIPIN
jgi:hypothetical protein